MIQAKFKISRKSVYFYELARQQNVFNYLKKNTSIPFKNYEHFFNKHFCMFIITFYVCTHNSISCLLTTHYRYIKNINFFQTQINNLISYTIHHRPANYLRNDHDESNNLFFLKYFKRASTLNMKRLCIHKS